jgi:dGTPase
MADPGRRALQQRQQELLDDLVAVLHERGPVALDPVFAEGFASAADDAGRLRAVIDQVALLTDAQARNRHRRWCSGD